jgi:zinc transporter 2
LNFGYFCSHDHASHDHGNHEHEPFSESSKLMTSHDHDHDHANDSHGHSHSPTSSSGGYGSFTHVDSPTKKLHKEHSLPAIEEYSTATEPSDVNIQAAYLHVMTDLIQSVGVALAGLLIWYKPEWQIIDPICTFLFSGLVIWSTFSLLGRVVSILFEGVPAHVSTMIIISLSHQYSLHINAIMIDVLCSTFRIIGGLPRSS